MSPKPNQEEFDGTGLIRPTTLAEVKRDFEQAGKYLRRKGSRPQKPSILLTAMDVIEIGLAEIAALDKTS